MAIGDTPTKPIPDNPRSGAPKQYYGESYLVDGAIDAIAGDIIRLTKGSAGAYTLAAPDRDNIILHIVSLTAQAHVITATDLLNGDNDTLTFGGAIGDSVILYSLGGEWFTGPLVNVTIG